MATALSNAPADPFEAFSLHIDDLYEQAEQYLDGEPIATPEQAEDVSRILNMVRKAGNDADDARKTEKKPHDDAAKAVQTKWKPILEKCDLAAQVAKRALAPWLEAEEARQRAAAQALKEEARQKAEAVAQANIDPTSLAGQAYQRAAREEVISIEAEAAKLEKKPVQARGGERAVSLRSVWTATLSDPCAALKHYRERRPEDLKAWLLEQAQQDVRAGARAIPGFEITEEKRAV